MALYEIPLSVRFAATSPPLCGGEEPKLTMTILGMTVINQLDAAGALR